MEYEGAGSFWAQLAAGSDDNGVVGVPPRKIDELLRNPNSSLMDILSDDEAISEFRSNNVSIVTRLTDLHGMHFIVNLITNRDLPDEMSSEQRLQLPYVATELVACEVDAMLDAFPRSVPGQKSPLDQLMSVILDPGCIGPTVMGYVVRVVNILITRRTNVIDRYIADHADVFASRLRSLLFDRSIADLLIRLLLEDDIKSFARSFSLLSLVSPNQAASTNENVLSIFQTVLNRSMVSPERMDLIWDQVKADTAGLDSIIESMMDTFGKQILRILVIFSYSRKSEKHSFATTIRMNPVIDDDDEDSCLFDDEKVAPPSRQLSTSGYSRWGQTLVDKLSAIPHSSVNDLPGIIADISLCTVLLTHSDDLPLCQHTARLATNALFKFPQSSALHTVVQAAMLLALAKDKEAVSDIFLSRANTFKPDQLTDCWGHVCKIAAACHNHSEYYGEYWSQINTRLADVKQPVVAWPDLTEWTKMDFAAFPAHVRNISDPEMDATDVPSLLTVMTDPPLMTVMGEPPLGDLHPLDHEH